MREEILDIIINTIKEDFEINESKKIIEKYINKKVNHFC